MAKCANCVAEAKYEYRVAEALVIPYCERDLPKALYPLKKSGLLTPKPVEMTKPSKKKTIEVVAEEPVVEESAVTEETTEGK